MFDPTRLVAIKEELGIYTAAFDPARLGGTAAERVAADAHAIVNMATTIKALAGARAAACATWKREGAKSPAHHLANKTGTTVGEAAQLLETAKRLEDQPEVDAAARRGELSEKQANAIADAAASDPDAAPRLLARAKHTSLQELKDECGRTKAAADPDPEARATRIHAARSCRRFSNPDGSGEIRATGPLATIAAIWSVIGGFANRAFDDARTAGRREPAEAYAFDGLAAMAQAASRAAHQPEPDDTPQHPAAPESEPVEPHAADPARETAPELETPATPAHSPARATDDEAGGHPAPPAPAKRKARKRRRLPAPIKIIVRVDWDALMRGWPIEGELCEVAGLGPVPVSAVREMIESGDAFLAALITKGTDIASVVHLGRKPTALQVSALQWRDPTCTRLGCANPFTQMDHRDGWALTKTTLVGRMNNLCRDDHLLKTRFGWELVDGTGKRPMVPPDHPDHPNNTHPPTNTNTNADKNRGEPNANAPPVRQSA